MAITPSASNYVELSPAARQERDERDERVRQLIHRLVRAVERGYHPFEVRRITSGIGRELRLQVHVTRRRLVVSHSKAVIEDVPIGKHMTDKQIDELATALILSSEN